MNNKKGFTLMEVIIFAAILILLLVMVIPALHDVRDKKMERHVQECTLKKCDNSAHEKFGYESPEPDIVIEYTEDESNTNSVELEYKVRALENEVKKLNEYIERELKQLKEEMEKDDYGF